MSGELTNYFARRARGNLNKEDFDAGITARRNAGKPMTAKETAVCRSTLVLAKTIPHLVIYRRDRCSSGHQLGNE